MATNNIVNIMDNFSAGLQTEVLVALQETKKCFDEEGRCFDEAFVEYFCDVSNFSVTAAYKRFMQGVLLHTYCPEYRTPNGWCTIDGPTDLAGAFSIQSEAESNNINHLVDEGSVALKREPDEASDDNTVLILDSDDEEDSHEMSIASTSEKAVGNEFVSVNDDTMESEDETMELNQNESNDGTVVHYVDADGSEVEIEINALTQKQTNDDDDISFDDIEIDPRIQIEMIEALMGVSPDADSPTDEISPNESSAEGDECSKEKQQETSNESDSFSSDYVTPKEAETDKKAMQEKMEKKYRSRFWEKFMSRKSRGPFRTRVKLFRCNICFKSFSLPRLYRKHLAKHENEEYYWEDLRRELNKPSTVGFQIWD